MEIIIKGQKLTDPRQRVLAIEAAMQAICEVDGNDAADGVMALLTAAAHIAMRHSGKPARDLTEHLAYALGCAIVAADDFFKLREVPSSHEAIFDPSPSEAKN